MTPTTDEDTPEPSAASQGVGKTPAQTALAALDGDQRSDLIALAHDLHVPTDDPVWVVIRAALDAQSAAYVASEAVGKLGDAPATIERAALEGAGRAAAEIRQHAQAGAEAVVAAFAKNIERSAAEPINKVMRPHLAVLDERVRDVRNAIWDMTKYQIDRLIADFLTKTTKEIDQRSVASKTAGRVSALLLLILGAALGVAGVKLDHRLSPTPIHLTTAGGYSIAVPHDFGGRFKKCGTRECVDLYRAQSNHK